MFTFNKDSALEYMKYQIRSKRKKLFPELDTQFMKALETGNIELQNQIILIHFHKIKKIYTYI